MTAKSRERAVLFAGTFDPFTVGHASVVERALGMFDRVVIAVGINAAKGGGDIAGRVAAIERVYAGEPRVEVTVSEGLTADLARRLGIKTLLRGVRSVKDFEYERDMADVNRRLAGLETVLLFTLPELAAVSSSVVRELRSYGRDISEFIP